MKQTFLYMLMAVLALTFGACSSDDGPQQDPTPKVDLDDDQTTAELNESYTYKLPVIFHVFYKDEAEMKQKVTASRLADILDHVNRIYQGGYYSTDIGTSENINIRFNLATHDERGNRLATPGVEYVKWDGTYPIDANDFMNNNKKGYARYLWEPNDYINVMVYPFAPEANSAEVTLGVSHLPFTLKGVNETDGLSALESKYNDISKKNLSFAYCSSINSDFIDYEVDRYTNASHNITSGTLNQAKFDINVTLAHELGHYLGLLHAFSEKEDANGNLLEDACDDTDYCTDTPSYNRPRLPASRHRPAQQQPGHVYLLQGARRTHLLPGRQVHLYQHHGLRLHLCLRAYCPAESPHPPCALQQSAHPRPQAASAHQESCGHGLGRRHGRDRPAHPRGQVG